MGSTTDLRIMSGAPEVHEGFFDVSANQHHQHHRTATPMATNGRGGHRVFLIVSLHLLLISAASSVEALLTGPQDLDHTNGRPQPQGETHLSEPVSDVVDLLAASFGDFLLPAHQTELRISFREVDNFVTVAHSRAASVLKKTTPFKETEVQVQKHGCTLDKLRGIVSVRFQTAVQEQPPGITDWSDAHTVTKFLRDRAFQGIQVPESKTKSSDGEDIVRVVADVEHETQKRSAGHSDCSEFLTLIRRRLFWGLLREWRMDLARAERGLANQNSDLWRDKASPLDWNSHAPKQGEGTMPSRPYATDGMRDADDVVYNGMVGGDIKAVNRPAFEGGHGVVMSAAEAERRKAERAEEAERQTKAAEEAERQKVLDTVEKVFGPMPGVEEGNMNQSAEDFVEKRLDWAVAATERVFEAKEQHRLAFLQQTQAAARRRGAEAIYSEEWEKLKHSQGVARTAAAAVEDAAKAVREAEAAVREVQVVN